MESSSLSRLLLDSHAFLWWCTNSPRLSAGARAAIADEAADVFVSLASIWEMAIKQGLGRLDPPEPIDDAMTAYQMTALPITFTHCRQVRRLPYHHRDPFDRMLVAQAQCEGLSVVTADPAMRAYDIPVVW